MSNISKYSKITIKNNRRRNRNQKLYIFFYKFKLTKKIIKKIRTKIELVNDYSEIEIRKKVIDIFCISVTGYILLVVLFSIITKNLYLMFLFSICTLFAAEVIQDFFVDKLKNKLLHQQIELNEQIRNKYYEYKTVDEAIYEACQETEDKCNEICIQGNKMADVLMSKDVEKEIIEYNEQAPNKYLKLLLGLSYITKDYGDTTVDNGSSLYMKSLTYLNNELRTEVIKRERLNYALKSLNIISLIPLFFIQPIKIWASSNFEPLNKFYSSKQGFVAEVIVIAIVFISFFLLKKIQNLDGYTNGVLKASKIEISLYEKGLYKIIDVIKPVPYSKKFYYKQKKLRDIMSCITITQFYTRKFILGAMLFIIGIFLTISIKQIAIKNILYQPTISSNYLGGKLSIEEKENALKISEFDRKIIKYLGNSYSEEKVQSLLIKEGTAENIELASKRIMGKVDQIRNQYYKWYDLILCILLFIIGYNFPDTYILFQKGIIKIDMEDEVSQFQTIILILMNIKRISVIEILEWMEMYSFYFKVPLQKCINNYESGAEIALMELKDETSFRGFIQIIENLQMSIEDISIREAFDELESEKAYYQENRKLSNERLIQRKQFLGQTIGFVPLYALIIIYLMIPMITTSIKEMQQYFNQLNLY